MGFKRKKLIFSKRQVLVFVNLFWKLIDIILSNAAKKVTFIEILSYTTKREHLLDSGLPNICQCELYQGLGSRKDNVILLVFKIVPSSSWANSINKSIHLFTAEIRCYESVWQILTLPLRSTWRQIAGFIQFTKL